MFYCSRSTHDCLCILLRKTRFSCCVWFGFGNRNESVLGFIGLGAVPCEVARFIAVVAIWVFGLEPIDLHQINLLDLLGFVLHRVVVAWFEPPPPLVVFFPSGLASGDVVESNGVVSVSCVRVRD